MNQKNKKREFLVMLLDTFCTSLLGNMLAGKGIIRAGNEKIRATTRVGTTGQDSQCNLIL